MRDNWRSHAISFDIHIRAEGRKLHTTVARCTVHC